MALAAARLARAPIPPEMGSGRALAGVGCDRHGRRRLLCYMLWVASCAEPPSAAVAGGGAACSSHLSRHVMSVIMTCCLSASADGLGLITPLAACLVRQTHRSI